MVTQARGTIVIQRQRRIGLAGTYIGYKILIDDQAVGKIHNGQTVSISVSAGEHYIQLDCGSLGTRWGKTQRLPVKVGLGQEVIAQCYTRSGVAVLEVSSVTQGAKVVETERYEVSIGPDEIRRIDNSQGISPIVRTFRLSRDWTRSYTVGSVESNTTTESAQLNTKFGNLRSQAEQRIEQHYSTTGQERHAFEDSVVVTVAPRTYSEIIFAWKEIRQRGYVEVADGSTLISRVSFELVTGLTFDQQQLDKSVS